MENYLMSSPTQHSHVFLSSDNGKAGVEEQISFSFQNGQNGQHQSTRGEVDASNDLSNAANNAVELANPHAKIHHGASASSVYEDLDFASDLPEFSYDHTISLDFDEEHQAPHAMITRNGHSKTFSFDGALQTPFSLNHGSKFSNFSHSRNISLDDSAYSREGRYTSGHSHSVSLASNSMDPPSGTFSHSISNSTLQSLDSMPQLSSSMSNKSLQDSPYSMVNVHPGNSASTPGRRRLSTSLSTSNLYATPLRGSSMHSPTMKVGKTPLKAHHVRTRSKPQVSIETGSSQLLASIASMKNLNAPASNGQTNLSPGMNVGKMAYTVPHSAPANHDGSNPFENSFISPKIDMSLSDLDATPHATPARFPPPGMNFTPIPQNQSFGGSLDETNLTNLHTNVGRLSRMDSDPALRKERKIDPLHIEDQDDDACKQLKRAKSYVGMPDGQRAPLSRVSSIRNINSRNMPPAYTQAGIDLLSPELVSSEQNKFRAGLKSYPASIDLAAITKSSYQNYSNYSPEREYDESKELLPPMATQSEAYPTQSQIHETSATQEIAKFAEKILNSDQKRPIIMAEDSDELDPKKKHKCPLCLARFQRPEHVKRHLKCHSSEKPFQCDINDCGRRFNRKDNLKAHLKKIHGKVV